MVRQAVISADCVKDYLGVLHPDPQKAENAARIIVEGRVATLFPDKVLQANSTNFQLDTKPNSRSYIDEEGKNDGFVTDSDDEDWYGDKTVGAQINCTVES